MKKEEAVEILKGYRSRLLASCSNQLEKDIEAFDYAILALTDNRSYEIGYQDGAEDGLQGIRPKGHWIRKVDVVGFVSNICSECGAEIELEDCSDNKFCFNCGADMREGGEISE